MGKKRMTSMRIDGEVIDKAKEIGLNISQFCENALKQAIKALEQTKIQTETNGGYIDSRKAVSSATLAGPRGFEPQISGSAGQRPNPD